MSRDPQRWRGALSFILLALSVLCLVLESLFIWMRATAFSPDGYVSKALAVEGQTLLSEKVTSFVTDDLLPQDKAEALAQRVIEPLPVGANEKELLASAIATTVRSQVGTAVNVFFESGPGQRFGEAISSRLSEEIVKLVAAGRGTYVCQNCQRPPRGARVRSRRAAV